MEMTSFELRAKVEDTLVVPAMESLSPTRFLPQETLKSVDSTGLVERDTQTKLFRCTFPGCGRDFQLKGNLKRHANIHKGDKKFACKFCTKRFLRKADMEVHYRVHTGEKPYRCKYNDCGKCFARCSDLLSHERTHTGKKPYACAFPGCNRKFARKFDLHKHQRVHEYQGDALGKITSKKRKLSPCQSVELTRNATCDCPSDVSTPFVGGATSSDAALTTDVLLPGPPATKSAVSTTGAFAAGRRKKSATTACLDTPTRPSRYELKCLENHLDSPPACFAALSSLDAFLLSQETLDLSRPFSLDAFPPCPSTTIGTSCCPAHLELRPPPPEDNSVSTGMKIENAPDMLDQLLTTFPPALNNNALTRDLQDLGSTMTGDTTVINDSFATSALPGAVGNSTAVQAFSESSAPDINRPTAFSPDRLLSSSIPGAASVGKMPVPIARVHSSGSSSSPANVGNVSLTDLNISSTSHVSSATPATATASVKFAAEKACLSTLSSSLLDYSRHNRSCGHLSIQHGNHRDYVVQNHLVCQDSVTRLGVKQRVLFNDKVKPEATAAKPVQCSSPKDTHRPGCGHLPVRHNDHIDYVVEDNLICQQASWLEDDNLELLGDDFWDFYGAIDAFPTN